MSTKALAILVTLALVMVGVSLIVSQRSKAPTGPAVPAATVGPVLSPALLSAMSVKRADGREERVVRGEAGDWNYVAGRLSWPAMVPETALAAISALEDELRKPVDASLPAPAEGGPALNFVMRDGETVSLRLASTSIGGRTTASVTSAQGTATAQIASEVLAPLLSPGPAGWRQMQALPLARMASRITLEDSKTTLSLSKIDRVWSMRRPINARASQDGVQVLLDALDSIRVVRFDDAARPDLSAMGLSKPTLTIQIEIDERTSDAEGSIRVRTESRELLIGGPADPKGDTRYAAADPEGSIVMVIPAAAINAVSLVPRNFLASTAASVNPSDVFMVTIRDTILTNAADRGYRREGAGWSVIQADGTRRPFEGNAVDELLDFLTNRPGEAEPLSPDDEIRTVRKVELFDSEGDAREILMIGYTADGALGVRSGNVLVMYKASDTPTILELPLFEALPPEDGKPAPVQTPTGSPVTK